MKLFNATPDLNKKESEKFLKKMKETEERKLTKADKEMLKNIKLASKIVMVEDKELFKELAKEGAESSSKAKVNDTKMIFK